MLVSKRAAISCRMGPWSCGEEGERSPRDLWMLLLGWVQRNARLPPQTKAPLPCFSLLTGLGLSALLVTSLKQRWVCMNLTISITLSCMRTVHSFNELVFMWRGRRRVPRIYTVRMCCVQGKRLLKALCVYIISLSLFLIPLVKSKYSPLCLLPHYLQ